MAEGTGFEPVKGLLPRVFETRAIGHYANPPYPRTVCAWRDSNLQPLDPQSNALSIKLQAQ